MDWVCTGHLGLPPQLQKLALRPLWRFVGGQGFTGPEQRRAVGELARLLPDLRVLEFGAHGRWRREDGVWVDDGYLY